MTAKEQAILDIKKDLKETGKSFLAFHQDLNKVMHLLVIQQLRKQYLKSRKK